MKLNRVGFVGWRGMVGSVLMERMRTENDFAFIEEPIFYTTSQTGQQGPDIGRDVPALVDARDLDSLSSMDVIVSCQGGSYTHEIHPALRRQGWQGYWIDAASALRMDEQATIILDPVNLSVIEQGLAQGHKSFIGGNCTVSLMLMALHGLFKHDLVNWMTVATYQAASGAGAKQMREMIRQMGQLHECASDLLDNPSCSILDIDRIITETLNSPMLPTEAGGHPLAGSLLPWIDEDLGTGTSREEWKGSAETNRILGRNGNPIPIESTCVRISTMRCHSQAFTIGLNQDVPMDEILEILQTANDWVYVVENSRTDSLAQLTPAAVTGTFDIPIGRINKLGIDHNLISAFTVGDQLLWGAAEPLRRMLRLLHAH